MLPMPKLPKFWFWNSFEAQNGTSTLLPSALKCVSLTSQTSDYMYQDSLLKILLMQYAKYSISKAVVATNWNIKNLAPCSLISNTEAQFSTESLDTLFC